MISWRISISALSAAASAACLFYLLLVSMMAPQALMLVPAAEATPPPPVGKAIDTLTVADRLRPSDEDIAKALRRAMENRSMETHETTRDSEKLAIPDPTPRPQKDHPAAFAERHVRLFEEFVQWRKSHAKRQWHIAPPPRGRQISLGASHSLAPRG
jgi:hypothetical protein